MWCRFGDRCNRSDCWFKHPKGYIPGGNRRKEEDGRPDCYFGMDCHRTRCRWSHPPGFVPGRTSTQGRSRRSSPRRQRRPKPKSKPRRAERSEEAKESREEPHSQEETEQEKVEPQEEERQSDSQKENIFVRRDATEEYQVFVKTEKETVTFHVTDQSVVRDLLYEVYPDIEEQKQDTWGLFLVLIDGQLVRHNQTLGSTRIQPEATIKIVSKGLGGSQQSGVPSLDSRPFIAGLSEQDRYLADHKARHPGEKNQILEKYVFDIDKELEDNKQRIWDLAEAERRTTKERLARLDQEMDELLQEAGDTLSRMTGTSNEEQKTKKKPAPIAFSKYHIAAIGGISNTALTRVSEKVRSRMAKLAKSVKKTKLSGRRVKYQR